jgi:uridylate kinase
MLAGAPVLAAVRAGTSRAANATVLLALALASWVLAGLLIDGVMACLPEEGRSAAGFLSIGNLDFNLAVLTPMIVVAAALAYRLAFGLVVAARGGSLRDCIRASLRSAPRSDRRPT